jgi:hypothetical protein
MLVPGVSAYAARDGCQDEVVFLLKQGGHE